MHCQLSLGVAMYGFDDIDLSVLGKISQMRPLPTLLTYVWPLRPK